MTQAAPAASSTSAPLGRPRNVAFVIIISIITLGIYALYWFYMSFQEMKDHTGNGVGGVVGLILGLLLSVVNWFLLPAEVGNMYEQAGEQKPVRGVTGFWNLIPLVGFIIWTVKVQGALNRYWVARGATPA